VGAVVWREREGGDRLGLGFRVGTGACHGLRLRRKPWMGSRPRGWDTRVDGRIAVDSWGQGGRPRQERPREWETEMGDTERVKG
jgi:hypothetical protein